MNLLKFPASIALSLILLVVSAAAQQKRPTPARPQKEPVAPVQVAPTPQPNFDTLLAADTYQIYGEVRSVGQFIRSSSMNEILEPILTLAGPPKEFRNIVKWLNLHADEVMTSRMLVALSPSSSGLPSTLFAIEFGSAEEAAKFQQRLDAFLPKVLPTPTPKPAAGETQTAQPTAPPEPQYYLQQAGSLIVITPAKFDLKKLRPAGSKLLVEDANFRTAHNRFNSESIFVYVDVDGIERQEEEQRQRTAETEKEIKKEEVESPRVIAAATPPNEHPDEQKETEETPEIATLQTTASPEPPPPAVIRNGPAPDSKTGEIVGVAKSPEAPNEALMALTTLMGSLSGAQAKWPAGFGLALSLDGESFDLRLLLVNKPNEKGDPIPFLPVLAPGAAIAPETPNILPADTEMLISMSLDFPQMLAVLSKPPPPPMAGRGMQTISEYQPPYTALEKLLKIKIKDDLLPLLGSEIAVSLPLSGLDFAEPPGAQPSSQPEPKPEAKETPKEPAKGETKEEPPTTRSPAVIISLRDKEGMRALLPKLIESLAFKGANSLAQTERRGDTELVSYAKILSYAFIGDFLVISPDDATVRHIVDSHLKGETLASEPNFKNYTRWQPRQVQGQIYVSAALMEGYRKWTNEPSSKIDDQMRALLARLSIVAQPVTYSLSNEGFGPLHELHVPKNLVLIMVTAISGAVNQPEIK
jgi:hypothetical protein